MISPRLAAALQAAQDVAASVVLDLRGVDGLDASALRVILEANARAAATGGRLIAVEGPAAVQRRLGRSGDAAEIEFVKLHRAEPPVQALLKATFPRRSA